MNYNGSREAVRVKVKKCEPNAPVEWRKFSVDPLLTSLEVLYSILAKAFNVNCNFSISYKAYDPVSGQEHFLAVLSDFDLDAAFLRAHNQAIVSATDPCLNLIIEIKKSQALQTKSTITSPTATPNPISSATSSALTQSITAGQRYVANVQSRLPGIFNYHVEKTLNMVQKAFNFVDEQTMLQPPRHVLSDNEFRGHLDSVGRIVRPKDLRQVIYLGGIEPSLRRVVWKHILNVYPIGMTGKERMDYMKRKSAEYYRLRDVWRAAIQLGSDNSELAYVTGMVRKDVLRTDRLHPFYAGHDDNQNIASLFNILTTYAVNHPAVSYCQGMSDIASPLLVTMCDEAQAYICFCALMRRLSTNFMLDGLAMTQKFAHLSEALEFYDPEFFQYLHAQQADDLLFCYRWLLLEMKREFAFEDALRMLEVLWSSLPADPPFGELCLAATEFQPMAPTPTSDTAKEEAISGTACEAEVVIVPRRRTPRETAYTKICEMRRQSSALSLVRSPSPRPMTATGVTVAAKLDDTKRLNQSLDESIGRGVPSIVASPRTNTSLQEGSTTRFVFPPPAVQSADKEAPKNTNPFLSPSFTEGHFKHIKERIVGKGTGPGKAVPVSVLAGQSQKVVKNFQEFLDLTNKKWPQAVSLSATADEPETDRNPEDDAEEDVPTDYCPMMTSMTQELRQELENLDRQVFAPTAGSMAGIHHACDSPESGDSVFLDKQSPVAVGYTKLAHNSVDNEEEIEMYATDEADGGDTVGLENTRVLSNYSISNDVFVWENPLLQMESVPEASDPHVDGTTAPLSVPRRMANEMDPQQMTNSCEEASEAVNVMATTQLRLPGTLPRPEEFGGGNPFLMFLSLTLLLQHRDSVMSGMDYNEMAMHFDKMVRKHNVIRCLNQARRMYASYLEEHGDDDKL